MPNTLAQQARRSLPRLSYYDTIPALNSQRAVPIVPCLFSPFTSSQRRRLPPSCQRSLHTSTQLRGGQAASFPKLPRNKPLTRRITKQNQINEVLEDMHSTQVQVRDQQRIGRMPDDIGMMKGTLVWPTGENAKDVLKAYPWFGRASFARIRLQVRRGWKRFRDYLTVIVAEKPKGWSLPKPKFRMTKVIAKDLHRDMYTAFARGQSTDLAKLHEITCETLRETLMNRILSRPKGVTYEWIVHNYIETKVVSHRSAILPAQIDPTETTTIRQAVVRVRSLQSMIRHVDESIGGRALDGQAEDVQTKERATLQAEAMNVPVVEYLVIQKRTLRGVAEGWKVWGMTKETRDMEEALTGAPEIPSIDAAP